MATPTRQRPATVSPLAVNVESISPKKAIELDDQALPTPIPTEPVELPTVEWRKRSFKFPDGLL